MTKTFNKDSIIPIGGFFALIENKQYINNSEYFYIKGQEVKHCNNPQTGNFNVIVATIGDRIEGVPLIELPDEDKFLQYSNKLLTDSFVGWSSDAIDGYKTALGSLTKFYKAEAQQQGRYSEEDILSFLKFLALDHNHKYNTTKNAWDDFKLSLQTKRIVSIELEYETLFKDSRDFKDVIYRLKITNPETNTIIPKFVSYGE